MTSAIFYFSPYDSKGYRYDCKSSAVQGLLWWKIFNMWHIKVCSQIDLVTFHHALYCNIKLFRRRVCIPSWYQMKPHYCVLLDIRYSKHLNSTHCRLYLQYITVMLANAKLQEPSYLRIEVWNANPYRIYFSSGLKVESLKLCMCKLFHSLMARLQATGNCSSTFCSTRANTAMLASHVPKRSLTSISFVLRNISLNHTIVLIIYIEATKSINVKIGYLKVQIYLWKAF